MVKKLARTLRDFKGSQAFSGIGLRKVPLEEGDEYYTSEVPLKSEPKEQKSKPK
jgi:hypothetical protein